MSPVKDGQEFHSIMILILQNRLEHCTQQVRKFHVKLRIEEAQRLEQEKTAKPLFLFSIFYLFMIFVAMLVDRLLLIPVM